MAYRFRLYAPTDGISWISIYYADANGANQQFIDSVRPQGDSTPCYDDASCTAGLIYLIPSLQSGVEIDHWLVNRDNDEDTKEKIYTEAAGVFPGVVTNLYVKVVLQETEEPTKYYASLYFDANGGKYPPDDIEGYTTNSNQYVTFDIPDDVPIRDGYVFAGWSLEEDGSGTIRQPGGSITLWGSEYGEEYTLYAVWETGGGGIYVDAGYGMESGTVFVRDSVEYVKGTIYVWDSGEWTKGV